MTKKKPDNMTPPPAADTGSSVDDTDDADARANEPGVVRTVTITHTPQGDGTVREQISIEGYPSQAVVTLMADMTSAFVAVLCEHVPHGMATQALFRSFLPGALAGIARFEKTHGVKRNTMDNMTNTLLMQLMQGASDHDEKDEDVANEG